MTNDDQEFVCRENVGPAWWKAPIVWSTLLFIAFLIYEITAKPVLGVLFLCGKFGWNDLLTGYWLRRFDPNRSRGRTFFWFLFAIGLLKVTIAAYGLCFFFSIVFIVFKARQRAAPFPAEILAALGVLCAGLILALIAVFLGFWRAFKARLRVWLTYPPFHPRKPGKENMAGDFLTAGVFILWFAIFYLMTFGVWLFDPQGTRPLISVGVWLTSIITFSALLRRFFLFLKKRLLAQHSGECWEGDFIGQVMTSQVPNWQRYRMLAAIQQKRDRNDQHDFVPHT